MSQGADGPIFTWTVESADPIDPNSPCAATILSKAEIMSSLTCFRAVKRAYINGKAVIPGWDSTYGVWKITGVNFPAGAEPGPIGTIGFELDAKGSCPTLAALCRGSTSGLCTYALFDATKKCCPSGGVDVV